MNTAVVSPGFRLYDLENSAQGAVPTPMTAAGSAAFDWPPINIATRKKRTAFIGPPAPTIPALPLISPSHGQTARNFQPCYQPVYSELRLVGHNESTQSMPSRANPASSRCMAS